MRPFISHPRLFEAVFWGIIFAQILLPSLCLSREKEGGMPDISISVSFSMPDKRMEGKSAIIFHKSGDTVVRTGDLRMKSVKYNGVPLEPALKEGAFTVMAEQDGLLEIEYTCSSAENGPCLIGDKGVLLTGNWSPSVDGPAQYRLTALVPGNLTAVSEAESIEVEKRPEGNLYSFSFPHPLEGLDFIAAAFRVKRDSFRDVELYACFFAEDEGLADTYLAHAKRYLELYEGMLGKFPYRRFSVVENFLPTGYSVPTFTLLGQDVVRLPFIVRTSLGHEILHQWLGNLVSVDYDGGNWSEGLTTYLSDHLYEEQEGRGWQYRKQVLIDFESYVLPEKEFPLEAFRTRTDFASRAIGYGKGAMVFHMLKKLVGEEIFSNALRSFVATYAFRKASWDDIRHVFEAESGKDLGDFFRVWLREKGFPSVEIKNIQISPSGLRYSVSFDLLQKEKAYTFNLPLRIKTESGVTREEVTARGEKQDFSMVTESSPGKLIIDEDYDVFRKPSERELPPVIGKLLSEGRGLLVLPKEDVSTYEGMVEWFRKKGYATRRPDEVTSKDLAEGHLLVLGAGNPLLNRLFGAIKLPSQGFGLLVKKDPFDPSKVIAVAHASSREELDAALGKISHYGKYSMIAFLEGKNTEKKIDESERGWVMPLREGITGIELSGLMKLPDIIGKVRDKKIIYIGEQHDKYEHHVTQFEAIRELFRNNRNIAVGMEMFQRPFQKALDDYIEGRIEEREFLRSSEYFKRWGFDYNLYKDILRFAREEKIPVRALNMRSEIVDKVSKQGMDSLTEEERKELPDHMDLTDEDYRQRLKEVFERHESSPNMDFVNFYQSQVIWDETMAQSVDEYLEGNPDRQMVVLAGGGHLIFGSGIPKRAFRRNRMDYVILLNDESLDDKVADYLLFPEPITMVRAPKLTVMLKKEDGRVKIVGFGEKSVAEKAGIRAGDVIVSLDGEKVSGIEDIQIFLFYKKAGDSVTVTVLRKRFLFGEREMRFEVTL